MGLVVLGMHRSGTSLIIGLLQAHGYSLGGVSEKISQYKPTGTKENLELRQINNKILEYNNCFWDSPANNLKINQKLITEMKAFCKNNLKGKWAIKDPRMVLTYRLWEKHLPKHKIISTIRHPLNVAQSLKLKNGLNLENGVRLWYIYNLLLIQYWKESNFPILNFELNKPEYFKRMSFWEGYLGIKLNIEIFNGFYSHKEIKLNNKSSLLDENTIKLYNDLIETTVEKHEYTS